MEASFDSGTIEDVDIGTREFIRHRWGRKFHVIGGKHRKLSTRLSRLHDDVDAVTAAHAR